MEPTAFKRFVLDDWDTNLAPVTAGVATARRRGAPRGDARLATTNCRSCESIPNLVAAARSKLAGRTITERIYQRLRRDGVGGDIPDFTISDKVGAVAPLVFARASGKPLTAGVPGLFTYAGYQAFDAEVEKVSRQFADEEPWVIGTTSAALDLGAKSAALDPNAKRRVDDDVRRVYLEDYARIWQEFIRDIRLVRARDLQQSINLSHLLAEPTSPLPVLMRAIVKEVTLVRREDADKNLIERGTRHRQEAGGQVHEEVARQAVATDCA